MIDCLVVGGDSPIGVAMRKAVTEHGLSVAWTSRRSNADGAYQLDLDTLEGLGELPPARATAIVAAETRFSVCEQEPERTYRINVEAPREIAAASMRRGGRVLFLSSIAVHGGSLERPGEDVASAPNTDYGKQKLAAELALLALAGDLAILRLAKVITPDFALFLSWLERLRQEKPVEAFCDMFSAPVYLDRAIEVAVALLAADVRGVFQFSASDQLSYEAMARRLAEGVGAAPHLVRPILARERIASPWLPEFATLGCERVRRLLGIPIPSSLEAVESFMATLEQRR